jgi:hypothetical protein
MGGGGAGVDTVASVGLREGEAGGDMGAGVLDDRGLGEANSIVWVVSVTGGIWLVGLLAAAGFPGVTAGDGSGRAQADSKIKHVRARH